MRNDFDFYNFKTNYSNQYLNNLNNLPNQNIIGQEQYNFDYLVGNNRLQTNYYANKYRNQIVNNPPQKRSNTNQNKVTNKKYFENSNQNKQIRNINQSPMNINNNNVMKNTGQSNYNINKIKSNPKNKIEKEIKATNPASDFQNNYNSNKIKIKPKKDEKEIKAQNPASDFDKDLLKVFIYYYFYEKYEKIVPNDKNKNIFINGNKNFYLINQDWLNNLKNTYGYEQLKKRLESLAKNYNYNNVESFIGNNLKMLSEENIIKKDAVFQDLKNVKKICTGVDNKNNIKFTGPGIILPSKIMDIIKSWDENVKNIIPKYFIFKFGLVYYINNFNPGKIIVGNLDKSTALFKPKYIFAFSIKLEKSEIEQITSNRINDYIAKRKCYHEKEGQPQQLKNEEEQPIGTLIILEEDISIEQLKKKYNQMENQYKKRNKELVNKHNNLVKRINNLIKQLKGEKDENQKIKKELDTLKQENASLKNNIQEKNNEFDIDNSKNKEDEINQLKVKLEENQNILSTLNEKNKSLQKENDDNKKYIENSKKKENNLLEEINKKDNEISNMKDIINKQNNYNKEINDLKQEIKQKIAQIANIKKDVENLENKNKQLIQQNNDKELELNKIKLDLGKMKKVEANLDSAKNKENEINEKNQELIEKEKNINNLNNIKD